MWLREATAGQIVKLGTFLDSTDGDTAETALTIANTDIILTKNNATTESAKNSGGATHISGGRYYATFDATDSNTLGRLEIDIHVAGALAVKQTFMVLPAEVYDSIVLGTDVLDVSVIQWLGTAAATPATAGIPHVNTTHVSNTAQTANDNGDDLNTLISRIIGTLAAGTHNPATAAQIAVLSDWINGGRLDLILDAVNTIAPDNSGIAGIQTDLDNATDGLGALKADIATRMAESSINTTAGAVDSVASVSSVTGSIGSLGAAAKSDVKAEAINALNTLIATPTGGSVWDVLASLDALLPVSGTLSVLDAAAVNSEVLNVMAVDTYTEPGQGNPPATTTLAVKINYLYKGWRNKKDCDGAINNLYADDEATVDQKQTVSESVGTSTKGEWVTGP